MFAPTTSTWSRGTPLAGVGSSTTCWSPRQPRFAGVRADYDRVVRQRNTLLKTAGGRGSGAGRMALATLEVWDAHLARTGAELLAARLALVDELPPHVARHYARRRRCPDLRWQRCHLAYRPLPRDRTSHDGPS